MHTEKDYFEKSREFGKYLLKSDCYKNLQEKRNIYQNSDESIVKMEEFNAYQQNINLTVSQNILTEEQVKSARINVIDLAEELKKDKIIGELLNAENEFNEFINKNMDIIRATLTNKFEEKSKCCKK